MNKKKEREIREEPRVFILNVDDPLVNQRVNDKECFVYELDFPGPLKYIYDTLYSKGDDKTRTQQLVRFITGLTSIICEVSGVISTSRAKGVEEDIVLRGALTHNTSTLDYCVIMNVPKEMNDVLRVYFNPQTMRFIK